MSAEPSRSLAEKNEAAKSELSEVAKRLGAELDALVNLCSHARECVTNELFTGVGHRFITDKDMRKLNELAKTVEIAVKAKIAFEKQAKSLADAMTPEQEFDSVVQYVRSLESAQISKLFHKVKERLDGRSRLADLFDSDEHS